MMAPAPVKPDITFEDLEKMDVRVGTIRSVEDVPGSKKLVRVTSCAFSIAALMGIL